MDESQHDLNSSLPPFVSKTYKIVDNRLTDAIISWSESNKSFIVRDRSKFCTEVLPEFFKHNNYKNFTQQLYTYGFTKVGSGSEPLEFEHPHFIRGRTDLLVRIRSRISSQSLSSVEKLQQTQVLSSSTLTDSESQVFWTLKHAESLFRSELEKHKEEKRGVEVQLQQLRDRLIRIEERHHKVMSSVAARLPKPADFAGLEPQRKEERRLSQADFLHQDIDSEHSRGGNSALFSIKELCERMESSLTFWGYKLGDVNHTSFSSFSDLVPGASTSYLERNCMPSIPGPQFNVDAQPGVNWRPSFPGPQYNFGAQPVIGMSFEHPAPPREQPGGSTSTAAVAGISDPLLENILTLHPEMLDFGEFNEGTGSSGRNNGLSGSADKWKGKGPAYYGER